MDLFKFEPRRIIIDLGETTTWWNTEKEDRHRVTAYEKRIPAEASFFDSAGFNSEEASRDEVDWRYDLRHDERYEHAFETPGHYHYFCSPHERANMVGTVVVRNADGDIPPVPTAIEPKADHVVHMGPDSFAPEGLTIQVGESVGWVNGTGIAHSVTARELPDNAAYFASGGFDSEEEAIEDWYGPREGDITVNQPYTHTFETAGEYEYYCILHDIHMTGSVTVEPENT